MVGAAVNSFAGSMRGTDTPWRILAFFYDRLAVMMKDRGYKTLAIDANHRPARLRLIHLLERCERWADAVEERMRTPALPGSEAFADSLRDAGGYTRALRAAWTDEAQAIVSRLMEKAEPTTNDIFAPPVVRLVQLFTWLGERQKVRSWRAQAVAADPAMKHWLATVSE